MPCKATQSGPYQEGWPAPDLKASSPRSLAFLLEDVRTRAAEQSTYVRLLHSGLVRQEVLCGSTRHHEQACLPDLASGHLAPIHPPLVLEADTNLQNM